MTAVCFTCCQKDTDNGENGENNQENPGTTNIIPNAVTDIDGNAYDAVKIGDQVWMAQNLHTTRYADGTSIPLGIEESTETPYRYVPGNPANTDEENMSNVVSYGYLYNWPAVMHGGSSSESNPSGVQGICPNGWHVPSDAEWTQLIDYIKAHPNYYPSDNNNYIAKAMAATWGWESSSGPMTPGNDMGNNNSTGFSALPAGFFDNGPGAFKQIADFWCSTETSDEKAHKRDMAFDQPGLYYGSNYKNCGLSVRCVHD